MAFLYKTKKVSLVITEDSDLIAFGVQKLLFKMSSDGVGQEIDISNLKFCESLNFKGFTTEMILLTCILSGCDYLKSIKGIGFKTAQKLVKEHGNVKSILASLQRGGKFSLPKTYELDFEKTLLTFLFSQVYDPETKKLVHLNDPQTHPMGSYLKKID